MRGLKHHTLKFNNVGFVASFTDAWIETIIVGVPIIGPAVASFTDAWIETLWELSQVAKRRVASFTDAWIETRKDEILSNPSLSHLLQMRGLKHFSLNGKHHGHEVASFTDAWIETYVGSLGSQAGLGRIFYRCVD